jgi:hypothetical protein
VTPIFNVGLGRHDGIGMRRPDHLVREVHQVGLVLEMAGIDGVGHVRFGRPIRVETAHLLRGDRVQKPILFLVGFRFVLAGLYCFFDDWRIG